jgi:hypothetical protein
MNNVDNKKKINLFLYLECLFYFSKQLLKKLDNNKIAQ